MKLIAACITLAALVASGSGGGQLSASAAAAVAQPAVGLYAPDRYDGIPEMCLLPMDFGYCRAKVKRYYFDMRRMKCAMFFWGGCAGNVNNFKSMDECNKVCLDDIYFGEVSNKYSNDQNAKSNNFDNNKNLKPSKSNYKSELKRIGIAAKINENGNKQINNQYNDQDDEEDYQQ